ncbi:MAG: DUF4340 domain-containing protein [Chthoniobacterales bacterium]
MKSRNTILLLLVVAGLAAYVFFFEKSRPSTREQDENEQYLMKFDQSKITGLDITNGDNVIQLRKRGDQWMMVSPVKDRANPASITPILAAASEVSRSGVINKLGKGGKLRDAQKDYGVQKAKVRLKLLGDGAPGEIHFGKDTAFEGKIYARTETDDDISVIKSDLRNLLVKDTGDFRDRHLTHFESSNVSAVKFKTTAGEIDLGQTGDDWNLRTPIKARAANARILDLISSVNNLTIAEFIASEEGNLAKYGLAEPRGSISFQARTSDEQETIEVGSPTEKDPEKIYVRVVGRPSVFVVPKSIGIALGVKPNDLRDNKLTRVSEDLIDRVTIEKPGQPPLVFARDQEHWKFLEGGQPANDTEIKRVIDVLNNTETKAFVDDTAADLKPYGLDQPVLTIRLSSYSSENTAEAAKGETPLATVQFGKTEGDVVYAHLAEEPFIVSVGAGILTNINATPDAFKKPEPLKP